MSSHGALQKNIWYPCNVKRPLSTSLICVLCSLISVCESIPDALTGTTGAVDTRGSLAYIGVTDEIRLQLYLIQPDESAVRHVADDGADFEDPAFAPDGRSLAVSSNRVET